MENEIYNLKLHEETSINDTNIIRVPGGWIYRYDLGSGYIQNTFVPYSDEFKSKDNKSEEGKSLKSILNNMSDLAFEDMIGNE